MIDMELIDLGMEHWREGAACNDVEELSFFPSSDDLIAINRAKTVCAGCPVQDDCLGFAIETRQPDGIWGGLTPNERTRLRRTWLEEMRRAS